MIARAITVESNGVLSRVLQRDIPVPATGQLLLRNHATSINYHDLIGIDGGIPGLRLGRVPFSDGSATVEACGPGVTGFAPGDAVIPAFFPNWSRGSVSAAVKRPVAGDQIDGTLQTHLCVSADSVARSPSGLTHEEIATLGCAALTAWRSVVVMAKIQPGQTVVLQGTGGVSLAALAFAKMLGARVIITSSSDEKLDRARALGADVTVNYRKLPDWHEAVLAETGGLGADLIVDVGGGATIANSVKAAIVGGHISVIGVLTGYEAANFPLAMVMSRNLRIQGITVGSIADLDGMCRAIELSGYRPVIDSIYDLNSAAEAVTAMRSQKHFGKIVIRVA